MTWWELMRLATLWGYRRGLRDAGTTRARMMLPSGIVAACAVLSRDEVPHPVGPGEVDRSIGEGDRDTGGLSCGRAAVAGLRRRGPRALRARITVRES